MTDYHPPLQDMRFALQTAAGLAEMGQWPRYAELGDELVDAVLEQAAQLASEVIAPLNRVGDAEPARLENGVVRTPPGFKEAYAQWQQGGWASVPFDPEIGGQGLPACVGAALWEMWQSANLAFAIGPLLTQGAVDAVENHGSDYLKNTYLAHLVDGSWMGTMNLTEPQAGSDLAAVRTKAERGDDGTYRITGQKIYITYGEQDWTDNIVHLVLARLPDAPAGVKGISLFVVPKFLVNEDGSLGARNDLRAVSLEHKLGIHGSPTAVMAYGDAGGAIGWVVGEENRGLEYMFTMMNNARLGVGLQGLGVAERAYQQARAYARDRVQGRTLTSKAERAPILAHPDVRRMLLDMRAQAEAGRALAYTAYAAVDRARHHPDESQRALGQRRVDLLTPLVKSWCTDMGVQVASLGVQVHGGMGYIEETGAAQHYRDARIMPIYEGTNGIQANDLAFRKVTRDGGDAAREYFAAVRATVDGLTAPGLELLRDRLEGALDALEQATRWVVQTGTAEPARVAAGASPYLTVFALVAAGHALAEGAKAAAETLGRGEGDADFLKAKLVTARHFALSQLALAPGLAQVAMQVESSVLEMDEAQF